MTRDELEAKDLLKLMFATKYAGPYRLDIPEDMLPQLVRDYGKGSVEEFDACPRFTVDGVVWVSVGSKEEP